MVVDKHHYRPLPIPNGDRSDFAIAGEVLSDSFGDVDTDAAFIMEDD
jgi:hypothetical protein